MASSTYPATNAQWQKHIRTVAEVSENVIVTEHVQDRMMQRTVQTTEVLDCLRHGSIVRPPRKHKDTGMLICRMEAVINGRNLAVAVDVESYYPKMVVTVTVMT